MTTETHKLTPQDGYHAVRTKYFKFRSAIWIGVLLMAMFPLLVSAQSPSFKVKPVGTVEVGQNFVVTFQLKNAQANPPSAPQLNNCDLLYGPSLSTMESSVYEGGRRTSTTICEYSFTYRAKSPGNVTVPAVSVHAGNAKLSSQAITFKILPADKNSRRGGGSSDGSGRYADDTNEPAPISGKDFFVKVIFSKSKAFEQEPIVATIKVYTRYDITNFLPKEQPVFNGFLSEELPVSQAVDRENINGTNYYCVELKKCLLYPQKPGKLTINAGKYDVTLRQYEKVSMGYFQTLRPVDRTITTTSNSTSILVEPLPTPKPDGFTNAVGDFKLSVSLTPELLKTNESALYTYEISGTGNIKFLTEPNLEFPPGFDTYTPKSEIDAHVSGANMTGVNKLSYTIVPQEVGQFTIKGTPFVFFNPNTRKYETIDPGELKVNVAKGSATSAVVEQKTIAKGMEDILYIRPTSAVPQTKEIKYIADSPWYIILYLSAAVILIFIIIIYRRKLILKADVSGRKLAKANSVANRRLREARGFMKAGPEHNPDKFYASLSKAIWGYISDKLGIPASRLTRDNIAEKLETLGYSQEAVKDIIDVLDTCETARFTPMGSDETMEEVYKLASGAIKSIENTKIKRPRK